MNGEEWGGNIFQQRRFSSLRKAFVTGAIEIFLLLVVLVTAFFVTGAIEMREMSEIVETLFEMEGVSNVCIKIGFTPECPLFCRTKSIALSHFQAIAAEKATAMFDQVDQDGDGELDEHEFIRSLSFNPSLLFHSLYIFFLSSPYSFFLLVFFSISLYPPSISLSSSPSLPEVVSEIPTLF